MDFEYETESEADIKIYGASKSFLINNMGADFGDFGVGLTEYDLLDTPITFDYFGIIKTIRPVLEARVYICSDVVGEAKQKNVVAHEFGHVLGYSGHSLVMYENNHTGFVLTQNDIKHLKFIYTWFR